MVHVLEYNAAMKKNELGIHMPSWKVSHDGKCLETHMLND